MKSSHHRIITSSNHHIIESSHHRIITSSNHHIIESSHHHIITSLNHHINHMKALVKSRPGKGIWMEEVPVPSIGVNEVLKKIKKTSICGTDLHIYKWDDWSRKTIKTPMTIGHEYVGEIVDMGSGVANLKVGDRVTGEGHIACGHCRNCRRGKLHVCENTIGVGVNRDGEFAEYLSLPAANVVKLDDRISDEIASIMDPFGNATHTALSFPLIAEDVLITRSEEHTSELQSRPHLVCRLLLEKKKQQE